MARRGENNERGAVPQFGAWDQVQSADGEYTSYSVVFTKAREKKKQAKTEVPHGDPNANEEPGPSHADRPHTFDAPRPRPHLHHVHSNPHPPTHSHPHPHPHPPPHPHHHAHSHSQEPPSSNKEDCKGMKRLKLYFGGCARP